MVINAEATRFTAGFVAPLSVAPVSAFIAEASPIVAKCGSKLASTPLAFD